MENAFIVQGGKPLKGEVQLSGAKNVALKVLIASLLMEGRSRFDNIPRILDVEELVHLIRELGADVSFEDHSVVVDPKGLSKNKVSLLHGSKIRTSFMFFAPLLFHFGKAYIPNPGGCRLGARPIDRHVDMLTRFGVDVVYHSATGYYEANVKDGKIVGSTFAFDKTTHTGTELAIMIAACAIGSSIIKNAAQEPEIDDLIKFLNQSGAAITRRDGDIYIEGSQKLTPPRGAFSIMHDRNEAPTYAVFGLATGGDVVVKGIKRDDIKHFVDKVQAVDGGVEEVQQGVRFFSKGRFKASDITTRPHPGFMTDWQGPWAVLMTQAMGVSTIHETVFENRFSYVPELRKLGAKIEYFQPDVRTPESVYQFNLDDTIDLSKRYQAIRVEGPVNLHNGVLEVKDLRAGATALIAACTARGESVVHGAAVIDRGYEKIEEKLGALGASIQRV